MYAIIEDGGKQYRVEKGDTLYIEQRELPAGQNTVEFDRILMLGDGEQSRIGTPIVAGAKVVAKLHGEEKGPKVDILKYTRRKGYVLRKGHRQNYLKVTVDDIRG